MPLTLMLIKLAGNYSVNMSLRLLNQDSEKERL